MSYWELVDHLRVEHPDVTAGGSDRNALERAHERAHPERERAAAPEGTAAQVAGERGGR